MTCKKAKGLVQSQITISTTIICKKNHKQRSRTHQNIQWRVLPGAVQKLRVLHRGYGSLKSHQKHLKSTHPCRLRLNKLIETKKSKFRPKLHSQSPMEETTQCCLKATGSLRSYGFFQLPQIQVRCDSLVRIRINKHLRTRKSRFGLNLHLWRPMEGSTSELTPKATGSLRGFRFQREAL